MFTQQANALSSALAMSPGAQQNQALLQVFANCIQGLRTNGPVSINTAAGRRAPQGGVINSPPGLGNVTNIYEIFDITNQNLWEYLYGDTNTSINSYPRNVWNVNNYNNPYTNNNYFTTNISNNTTNQGGNTANYFGGDTFYGDSYLSSNEFKDYKTYNAFANNDYNTYNTYNNPITTNVHNSNISSWSNSQYIDNSYNDFSTSLQTTQNIYGDTHNNFEGDSYFDNVVNEGDVVNISNVTNQGDVYNEGDTYFNENKVFISNNNNSVNLATYVYNMVVSIINGGGGGGPNPPPPILQLLPTATFTGTPSEIKIPIPTQTFNAETCELEPGEPTEITVPFTPAGTVTVKPG